MKTIVSVSLGSHLRDHEATLWLFGHQVHLSRRGCDGNLLAAEEMIRQLDGCVDAIGLGGIDRYLIVKEHWYEIKDAVRLAEAAQKTPVVDGSGVKDTLERRIVMNLHRDGIIHAGQSVLMVSAMDRFGMAETFHSLGYSLLAGDLIFSSRINYPIRSVDELEELARKLLPELTRMPFDKLYPLGEAQTEEPDPRYAHYFKEADIIAGDFHYIRRYMPSDISGKLVVTNTTTESDLQMLRARGAKMLVTTTPVLNGRSFGANVIEAALVATSGLSHQDPRWVGMVDRAGLLETRLVLNDGS